MTTKMREYDFSRFAFSADSDFGVCLSSFLRQAYERSGSRHTLEHYHQMLTDFFSHVPVKQPDRYDRADIEAFIHSPINATGRVGNPPGAGTKSNRLSCLSSFYTYAAAFTITNAEGVIQPVLRVPAPTLGIRPIKRPRSYHTLSTSEVTRFFAVIPRSTEQGLKYVALFTTFLYTSRRKSEILEMRWKDIERVTINEKGQSREAFTFAFHGKGKKMVRDCQELPENAAAAIFTYLTFSGRMEAIQPDDYVFVADTSYKGRGGYDPKRPLHPSAVWSAAKRFARRACIDEQKMNVHAFRHVSSRTRYDQGEDIRSIQKILRHSSLSVTDKYLSVLITPGDNGAKLLSSVFGNL